MTLTAILPTLRRTLPDPINIDAWPECSHVTTTDVVVGGVSMLRLVELCQTPCVHTATAVIPGTHGRPSPYQDAAVIVVRVSAVEKNFDAARVVLVNARLDTVHAVWRETRLIGRASTAKNTSAIVLAGESDQTPDLGRGVVELPADLREGDLLAIPCTGIVALRDVRAQRPSQRPTHSDGLDPAVFTWLEDLE